MRKCPNCGAEIDHALGMYMCTRCNFEEPAPDYWEWHDDDDEDDDDDDGETYWEECGELDDDD